MKTFRPCLAEFIGTFYLCFAGIAAILCTTPAVGVNMGLVGIALAHGIALSVAVNAFRVIFPVDAVNAAHLGIPLPAPWATTGVVLTAEFIMTYLLMTAIFGTAVDE